MKKVLFLCSMLAIASFAWAQPHIAPWLPPGVEPGIPDFSDCDVPSCDLECPDDAIEEGELCPDLEDDTNGGCYCFPPEFTPIECDQTVCGTVYSRFFIRDTDWYQLDLDEAQEGVSICATGEIPLLVALVQPGDEGIGCTDMEILEWVDQECPCEEICISADLEAGTYWIVVVPALFNCAQQCADYILEVDCEDGEELPNVWDMGDLEACYPTEVLNPAHRITGIAWLGAGIDEEDAPQILDEDEFDDGVTFNNAPWMPCTEVSVTVDVTAGPNYQAYVDTNGVLYLNAWKDGDLNCSFCDELCDNQASEHIIQNEVVTPGQHTFSFTDPGVFDMGRYHGHLRFRLSDQPLTGCPPQATSDVGEVEDYIIEDLQLAVELQGSLLAFTGDGSVTLKWTTASETGNERFEIQRDGQLCGTRPGAGTSAASHEYSFTESGLQNGRTYNYKLYSVDVNGTRQEVASVDATPAFGTGEVSEYALHGNYPNPFNPATSIRFDLVEDGFVTLTVYNLMGQEVATLVNGTMNKGHHAVSFDATELPSGAYLYKLTAGNFTATRKMLLLK